MFKGKKSKALAVVVEDFMGEALAKAGIEFKVTKEDLFDLVYEKTREELQAKYAAASSACKECGAKIKAQHLEDFAKGYPAIVALSKELGFEKVEINEYYYDQVQFVMGKPQNYSMGIQGFVPSKSSVEIVSLKEESKKLEAIQTVAYSELQELSSSSKKMRLVIVQKILGSTPEGQKVLEGLRLLPRPVKKIEL